MSVDVCKLKAKFTENVGELYSVENFFIEICKRFPSKYSLRNQILDDQLRIFFEENNKIVLDGKLVPYCTDESKRKIKLINITTEKEIPEAEVTNYIIENTWKKIDW